MLLICCACRRMALRLRRMLPAMRTWRFSWTCLLCQSCAPRYATKSSDLVCMCTRSILPITTVGFACHHLVVTYTIWLLKFWHCNYRRSVFWSGACPSGWSRRAPRPRRWIGATPPAWPATPPPRSSRPAHPVPQPPVIPLVWTLALIGCTLGCLPSVALCTASLHASANACVPPEACCSTTSNRQDAS